ncbi:DUF3304 domain-containing protein [Paraburkholderia sp. T12-10]|nr:DUF3304 domain-containing protein [Paraburkholderia sp. T12-10]
MFLMRNLAMRTRIRIVFVASLMTALIGCSRAKPIGLSIEGYNYTSRFIADLTVTDESGNSAWGGDVLLSTPTAGGGKDACCVMLDPDNKKPVRLRVAWTFDRVDDANGHTIAAAVKKTAWVTVSPPYPSDPQNFEVHFYPDGHVEAAVTHWSSPPRILLPEDRRPRP